MNSPLRKLEVYQSDDGRKIEVFTKVGTVPFDRAPEDNINKGYQSLDNIYIGVVRLRKEETDPKTNKVYVIEREKKFLIEANSIEDAFSKYYGLANKAAQEEKDREKLAASGKTDTEKHPVSS